MFVVHDKSIVVHIILCNYFISQWFLIALHRTYRINDKSPKLHLLFWTLTSLKKLSLCVHAAPISNVDSSHKQGI